ncbi:MAG: nuclear transport factor 2 family protein [Novosphingobium sp.]
MIGSAEQALAIANTKARYCAAADKAASDPDAARAVFRTLLAVDVVTDYGFGKLDGIEAAAEFMCTTIPGNSAWMLHMLSTPLIEVDGAEAVAEWAVLVHAKRRGDGRIEVVQGRYLDRFRRTPEGWRIASVRFTQLT